jgi:hypothetical protein
LPPFPFICTGEFGEGVYGTSVATAFTSGVAALAKSRAPDLTGEDLAQVLKRTAEDNPDHGAGWDDRTGWGLVKAKAALDFVSPPRVIERGVATNLTPFATQDVVLEVSDVPGLSDGYYLATRYDMRATVSFTSGFVSPPDAWARCVGSVGWSPDSPHHHREWPEGNGGVVSVGQSECQVRTFVFYLRDWFNGDPLPQPWWPCQPAAAQVAWTAIGPTTATPDPTQSFYVPQTGPVGSPSEGMSAVAQFRACPNNDGGSSLPGNARIKIVLKDASGTPIEGVSAADIYVKLNGGTAAQGFFGNGADSIIANSQWNQSPLCPDVRFLTADAPTDANGVAYITFTGSTPGNPGVGTRDPNRKWGHYDSKPPVYALGMELQGRLTSGDANGSYVLRIKNLDVSGGLGATIDDMNTGERVDFADYASVAAGITNPGSPLNYWRDVNGDGSVSMADVVMIAAHYLHDCSTPNNP